MQGNNINLSNLTFTPQQITQQNETTHITFTKVNNTVYTNGRTVEGILNISANGKTITKNISMSAADVYENGRDSVKTLKTDNDGTPQVFYETDDNGGTDYTKLWIRLENDKVINNIDVSGAYNAGVSAGGSPNISSLTFTPQEITQSQTIDIQFTESNNTVYVNGKIVQGKLKIEANNGQSITKIISMTAAGVYDAGVKTAEVDTNYISSSITNSHFIENGQHYIKMNIGARAKGTYADNSIYYSSAQLIASDWKILANDVYNAGWNGVDSLKSINNVQQIFYENDQGTTDYTKIYIQLENNKTIGNIELPKVNGKTLYQYAYDLGASSAPSGTISVSSLDITSATNYDASSSRRTDITGDASTSGKPNYPITAKGAVKVNDESYYSNVALDITGIMEDLYLERYSVSIRDYNSNTHRLYLTSNYEVRLDNGKGEYKLILDVYDKGNDNSVDISNYISGGSGIDINDVRLYLSQASNVSDDYDTGISMTAGYLTYDSDNDRLIGYANAFLDTGTNTKQDSRRVKIIMSASKKPGSGSTTINTTGVIRVLSGSTYKEAYQSGNSWYIDVKPTVNGTEYTTVPINVSDVYTKGYNANQGTVGSWSYTIEDKDIVYEEDPLTLSFGSEVNYYNGYLYGNVNIKHGTYSQRFTVSMSTEDVPTGGDTPSGGSYARTGQNFYVDEQSYDYGYLYDGSSSKVAITGYVEVDGHRVWVNSFDIGVGSIWWDGYQNSGGSGKEVNSVVNYAGDLHSGQYGSKHLDLTTRVWYTDGTYDDYDSGVDFYV